MEYVEQRKDPLLAGVLSLFLPGAGHMYCGNIGKGVAIFIIAIIGYVIFVVPGIIVGIFAAIDANKTAKKINEDLAVNQNIIEEKKELEVKEKNNRISSIEFIEKLNKVHKLYKSEMLSEEEYIERKGKYISELSNKKLSEEPEDFLSAIVILKEELTKIKTIVL